MKKSIYIFSGGELRRKDNTLLISTKDWKRYVPIETVSEIFLFGEVTLNTNLLNFLSQKEIIVHYFNYYGYYSGTIYPRERLASGEMIVKQAGAYIDQNLRKELAMLIASGSLQNILRILSYYEGRGKNVSSSIDRVKKLKDSIERGGEVDYIMGLEGNARDEYYGAFNQIIGSSEFKLTKRTRRPPSDPINALISFGNSVLYTDVLAEIYKTHLDPRIGFLHSSNFRKFSLNLDVSEIFKPVIVDRTIFTLVNKSILNQNDFEKSGDGMFLSEHGRKSFLGEYEQKMSTTIKHRSLGRNVSYRRLIRMELYKIEKHLLNDQKYIPFKAYW